MFLEHYKDPRRARERRDSRLINEDHTQMANLPRQAIHHEFPEYSYISSRYIDAGIYDRARYPNDVASRPSVGPGIQVYTTWSLGDEDGDM